MGGGGGGGGARYDDLLSPRGAGVLRSLLSIMSGGGGVLPRGRAALSCPLARVGAPPRRPALRDPDSALSGGSRTLASSSCGSVSSTRL